MKSVHGAGFRTKHEEWRFALVRHPVTNDPGVRIQQVHRRATRRAPFQEIRIWRPHLPAAIALLRRALVELRAHGRTGRTHDA